MSRVVSVCRTATTFGLCVILLCGSLSSLAETSKYDVESVRKAIAYELRGEKSSGKIKLSVAIKGGVSLGSYEAGVNWTLLRFLKTFEDAQLLASAGASAGAINGVLSAVYWCRDKTDQSSTQCTAAADSDSSRDGNLSPPNNCDTLERNFIRDSWREIGIEGLLDESRELRKKSGGPPPLREDNAVFSRQAPRDTQKKLMQIMRESNFEDGCHVDVGLTLTRANPVLVDSAGVQVANQRLVVPIKLKTSDQKTFMAQVLDLHTKDEAFNRAVIHLDDPIEYQSAQYALRTDTVFDAIKASASFPVAFAPVKLSYCIGSKRSGEDYLSGYEYSGSDGRCLADHRRLTSYFVDGGVFDNDPLALVRHLTEVRNNGVNDVYYVNIDPGRRRLAHDFYTINALPFNQPGDSIDIEMLSKRPAVVHQTPADQIKEVSVLLCDVDGNQKHRQRLKLFPAGDRAQRHVGTLHTKAAPETECDRNTGGRWSDGALKTCFGEKIRIYPPGLTDEANCANPSGEQMHVKRPYAISAVVEIEPQGLSTQLGFLGGAIESGRNAQLYAEVVGQDWADGLLRSTLNTTDASKSSTARQLFQPARLTPLVGDLILAFGAFLDERFRDFDYYAGVYDAVFGIAEFRCYSNLGSSPDCLGEVFESVYKEVCPECNNELVIANAMMRHFIVLDVCGAKFITQADQTCSLEDTSWEWINSRVPASMMNASGARESCVLESDSIERVPVAARAAASGLPEPYLVNSNELLAIGRALVCAEEIQRNRDRDPFVNFIQQLAEDSRFVRAPAKPTALSRMLAKHKRPVSTWYYPLARTAVAQLLPLETEDEKIRKSAGIDASLASTARGGLAAFGLSVETAMADRTGWRWHLSTVPQYSKWNKWAPLLPSEAAVDTRNGGLNVYWETGYRSMNKWAAELRIAPYIRQRFGNDTIEFGELSGFFVYRSTKIGLSSLGIGPTATHTWTAPIFGKRDTLGASAYAGLLGDKLRVTYGVRSFSHNDFDGDNVFWQLSVRDIPGFIFWGLQAK